MEGDRALEALRADLADLTALHGVSGSEHSVVARLRDLFAPLVSDVSIDHMGNLAATIAVRRWALVAHDEPVATPRGATDLAKLGAEDHIADRGGQRHTDGHEAVRFAGSEPVGTAREPGGAFRIVGPPGERRSETLVDQHACAGGGDERWLRHSPCWCSHNH